MFGTQRNSLRSRWAPRLLALSALALVLAAPAAEAGGGRWAGGPEAAGQRLLQVADRRGDRRARRYSLDEATAEVRRSTRGKVLSAEPQRSNGDELYRFRVLSPEGRLRDLYVDPRTNRPVRPHRR
jgi:hypothetical protein